MSPSESIDRGLIMCSGSVSLSSQHSLCCFPNSCGHLLNPSPLSLCPAELSEPSSSTQLLPSNIEPAVSGASLTRVSSANSDHYTTIVPYHHILMRSPPADPNLANWIQEQEQCPTHVNGYI